MTTKTKSDPTGQRVNRAKARKKLQNRLLKAKARIKRVFRDIPRTRFQQRIVSNNSEVYYDYDLTPAQLEFVEARIRAIIEDELLETPNGQMPVGWFWKDQVELPYRQGTAEEVVQFNQLTAAVVAAGLLKPSRPPNVDVGQYLRTNRYFDQLQKVYSSNFNTIRSLAEKTITQVTRVIRDGMGARRRPSDITADIDERFGVAVSGANRDADTEINRAYNDARLETTDALAEETGLRAVVIHLSAFLPTTRRHHASRHGNAYTVQQQNQWWDQGANRINCHCSTQTALVDSQGNLYDPESREAIHAERSFFDE